MEFPKEDPNLKQGLQVRPHHRWTQINVSHGDTHMSNCPNLNQIKKIQYWNNTVHVIYIPP